MNDLVASASMFFCVSAYNFCFWSTRVFARPKIYLQRPPMHQYALARQSTLLLTQHRRDSLVWTLEAPQKPVAHFGHSSYSSLPSHASTNLFCLCRQWDSTSLPLTLSLIIIPYPRIFYTETYHTVKRLQSSLPMLHMLSPVVRFFVAACFYLPHCPPQ